LNTADPSYYQQSVPKGVMKSVGSVLNLSGTLVQSTGYVFTFIPHPAAQSSSKYLIPMGEGMQLVGTALTASDELLKGEYYNFAVDVTLAAASKGIGTKVESLNKASKIYDEQKNIINLGTTVISPLAESQLKGDYKIKPCNNSNCKAKSDLSKSGKGHFIFESNPMVEFCKQFQDTTPKKDINKSNENKSNSKIK
jgi:hypothetical protein